MPRLWKSLTLTLLPLVVAAIAGGCGTREGAGSSSSASLARRAGDPVRGRVSLFNNGAPNASIMSCGVPYRLYQKLAPFAPAGQTLPDRSGVNASLPYYLSVGRSPRGVDVVGFNCLLCHGGFVDGQLVVGLGSTHWDFTYTSVFDLVPGFVQNATASIAQLDTDEQAELARYSDRMRALGSHVQTRTLGTAAPGNIFQVLGAHRDGATLAWSNDANLSILPPDEAVPLDPPPLWRTRHRTTMYYSGAGHGDLTRMMMSATVLCVDSVEEARAVDDELTDVRAYLNSIVPPVYPLPIDPLLAEQGRALFDGEGRCADCHGTYGEPFAYAEQRHSYLEIGTDPTYADWSAEPHALNFADWYNRSWFGTEGSTSQLVPEQDPELRGYIAPPLQGIWATAPYLHNGSVPTLQSLFDSSTRPQFWARPSEPGRYNWAAVGLDYTPLLHGQDDFHNLFRRDATIYDTTKHGYSNAGHTYGDWMSPDQRTALIEYLKTL